MSNRYFIKSLFDGGRGEGFAGSFLFLVLLVFFCLSASSCRSTATIRQEVPVYLHDTVYNVQTVYDSVYIDRVHKEYVKGDSVYFFDTVTRVRVLTKRDTVRLYSEVPVETTKEVEKVVEKPLSWIEKTLMVCGGCFALCVLAFIIYLILRVWRKC